MAAGPDNSARRSRPTAEMARSTRHKLYASNARLVVRRGREDRLVVALGRYLKPTDEAMVELEVINDDHDVLDVTDEQLAERAARYWSAYEAFADECKAVAGNLT